MNEVSMRFLYLDVILEGEVKPTKEQIEKARKLQLPPTFYLYENKEPCKGCRGCTEDLSSILSSESMFNYFVFVVIIEKDFSSSIWKSIESL
jgi:hypothetical protein